MTAVEVLVLVIGIIIFIAHFFIPEKKSAMNEERELISEEKIKEIVDTQMKGAKGQMQEMVDETISYSVEKAERAMERLTNEKISAVSEFSDTVLGDINKNRDEVLFLYDMLNDKHENLKEAAVQIGITTKEANEVNEALKESLKNQQASGEEEADQENNILNINAKENKKGKSKRKTSDTEKGESSTKEVEEEIVFEPFNKLTIEKIELDEEFQIQPDIQFDENQDERVNNNEKILEMHKMNKSNVAIAKELGLGVGEVKLVIDLYKGM